MTTLPQTDPATLLDEDLTELFEDWEIPHGAPLRDYPYAVDKLVEILHDHAERIAPRRYVEGARYPVVITTTQRYVVWVEAETAKDAVGGTKDNSEWYELISGETAIDADYEIEAPDHWENHLVHEHRVGPNRGCQTCNAPRCGSRSFTSSSTPRRAPSAWPSAPSVRPAGSTSARSASPPAPPLPPRQRRPEP